MPCVIGGLYELRQTNALYFASFARLRGRACAGIAFSALSCHISRTYKFGKRVAISDYRFVNASAGGSLSAKSVLTLCHFGEGCCTPKLSLLLPTAPSCFIAEILFAHWRGTVFSESSLIGLGPTSVAL